MSEIQALIDIAQNHPVFADLAKQGFQFVVKTALSTLWARKTQSEVIEGRGEELIRLQQTMEELREYVLARSRAGTWNAETADHEAREPSTVTFVSRAVNLSIDARVESKRRLIGRLISRRLQINDSDEDETIVSNALDIVGALSERQLLAVAAIRLTKNLGEPETAISNLSGAEEWLTNRHGQKVRAITASAGWDDRLLEGLGRAGAVTMPLHRTGTYLGRNDKDDVERWLAVQKVTPYENLRDNVGSPKWIAEVQQQYPTLSAMHALSRGSAFSPDNGQQSYRLDELHLTHAGNLLGGEILETLSRQTSDLI